MSITLVFLSTIYFLLIGSFCTKIDPKELKCLVCEKMVEEIEKFVSTLDHNIEVDAGGYRLDADGNLMRKTVSQASSEVFLSEALEKICEKMDDYVRATWKDSGKLMLLKLMGDDGKMSSDMANVDIIQDGDLNKSLKYYCEGIIEEHEDAIIKNVADRMDDLDIRICSLEASFCNKRLLVDEL